MDTKVSLRDLLWRVEGMLGNIPESGRPAQEVLYKIEALAHMRAVVMYYSRIEESGEIHG